MGSFFEFVWLGPRVPVWMCLVLWIVLLAARVYATASAAPISGANLRCHAVFGSLEGAAFGIVLVCTTSDEEIEQLIDGARGGEVAPEERTE